MLIGLNGEDYNFFTELLGLKLSTPLKLSKNYWIKYNEIDLFFSFKEIESCI